MKPTLTVALATLTASPALAHVDGTPHLHDGSSAIWIIAPLLLIGTTLLIRHALR